MIEDANTLYVCELTNEDTYGQLHSHMLINILMGRLVGHQCLLAISHNTLDELHRIYITFIFPNPPPLPTPYEAFLSLLNNMFVSRWDCYNQRWNLKKSTQLAKYKDVEPPKIA